MVLSNCALSKRKPQCTKNSLHESKKSLSQLKNLRHGRLKPVYILCGRTDGLFTVEGSIEKLGRFLLWWNPTFCSISSFSLTPHTHVYHFIISLHQALNSSTHSLASLTSVMVPKQDTMQAPNKDPVKWKAGAAEGRQKAAITCQWTLGTRTLFRILGV